MKEAQEPGAGEATGSPERLRVGPSTLHGLGVFARIAIPEGELLLEYLGEITDGEEAEQRQADTAGDDYHTFLFAISDTLVIDANVGGNAARYVNHSCEPNCETEQVGQRVFIYTLRAVQPGEELLYDYRLVLDEPHTPAREQQHACRCGTPACRGTMLGER